MLGVESGLGTVNGGDPTVSKGAENGLRNDMSASPMDFNPGPLSKMKSNTSKQADALCM
jgi:hypothetical protein